MSILIVFVTADRAVCDIVAERRTALVPSDLRANGFAELGGDEVILSAYCVTKQSTLDDLLTHICALNLQAAKGVLILTDNSLPDLTDILGDLFSVSRFDLPEHGRKHSNVIGSIIAKCLRSFRYYNTRFNDLKYHQVLRLPLRNFEAAEIGDLRNLCHDMMNSDNFGRQLDRLLHLLRQRQRPKKASSRPDIYFVDDAAKHFRFGKEMHARADTACPPHNYLCRLGNQFRFGCSFDGTRHFNVSRDKGIMNDDYPDCHDMRRSGQGTTHLNMFTNDFF